MQARQKNDRFFATEKQSLPIIGNSAFCCITRSCFVLNLFFIGFDIGQSGMFFAICLADFYFFAAKVEIFVFRIAQRPAAGVVVEIGQLDGAGRFRGGGANGGRLDAARL